MLVEREPDDDRDDEALSWAGDEERGVAPPVRGADGSGTAAEDGGDADEDGPAPASGLLLVAYGVLAGVTLISALGWASAVGRVRAPLADLAGEVMSQFGGFLAIAGPVIWFLAVLVLARGARPSRRILLHLLGLALTAPWPLLLGLAR